MTSAQFSLSGQLFNRAHEKVFIIYASSKDSVLTDAFGNFQYHNNGISSPGTAYFRIGNTISTTFYVAPGYHMNIQADAENRDSFRTTFKLTGIGGDVNAYWSAYFNFLDTYPHRPLSDDWYDIPVSQFIDKGLHISAFDTFIDDINARVFHKALSTPFKDYFENYSNSALKYENIWFLLKYAGWNGLSVHQVDSLLDILVKGDLLPLLNEDSFLENYHFKDIVNSDFLDHVVKKQVMEQGSTVNEWTYPVEVAAAIYEGAVRESALRHRIQIAILNSFSFDDLNFVRGYIDQLSDTEVRGELYDKLERRTNDLQKISFGKQAPDFQLPDEKGNYHQLSSFQGKVVFIALWASWCGPCKQQMPAVKEINDFYANNEQVQVINIAINDRGGKASRLDFIKANDLNWLQLEDENRFVADNYQIGTIPRFILIDKDGKIISADAPFPKSNKRKIMEMINKAIAAE